MNIDEWYNRMMVNMGKLIEQKNILLGQIVNCEGNIPKKYWCISCQKKSILVSRLIFKTIIQKNPATINFNPYESLKD